MNGQTEPKALQNKIEYLTNSNGWHKELSPPNNPYAAQKNDIAKQYNDFDSDLPF